MKKFITFISKWILPAVILVQLTGCFTPSKMNQAAWDNDIDQIKALIQEGQSIEDTAPSPLVAFGVKPLDVAIEKGNYKIVKIFIDSGANIKDIRPMYAETPQGLFIFNGTPLMLAALKGDLPIVQLLLSAGADIKND